MNTYELKKQIATVIEEVATVNKYLSEISPSLLAVRRALEEVSPDRFEAAYEKYFSGQDCETIRKALDQKVRSLLESARLLQEF